MAIPENTPTEKVKSLGEKPETVTMEKAGVSAPNISDYELSREERIKANRERMQKLGIADISLKLNDLVKPSPKRSYQRKSLQRQIPLLPLGPTRRSSRLQNSTPVSYCEVPVPKKEKHSNRDDILREVGSKPEVYTEEHEKLLGCIEKSWIPFVDGYGKDGKRIYDPVKGKTCHQCRQKTLGHRTCCSQCNMVQGQFCGDCLFMRYGENVLEANENPDWICPVCRGICNCSLCRQAKGWPATGSLYRKISSLGFKSVAHYLIQTRRSDTEQDNSSNDNNPGTEDVQVSAKRSLPFSDVDATKGDDDDLADSSNEHSNTDLPITKLDQDTGDSKINPEGDDGALFKSSNEDLNMDHSTTKLNKESEVERPLKPEPEIRAAEYDKNEEVNSVVYHELDESIIKLETVTETESTIDSPKDSERGGGGDDKVIKSFVALEGKSPKSSKKCAGYEPKTPDSIGGRLRQRHNLTNDSIASRLKRRRIAAQ